MLEARFRNGDVRAGAEYLGPQSFGLWFAGTQQLIRHVQAKSSAIATEALVALVRNEQLDRLYLGGALALAGHFATKELIPAIVETEFRVHRRTLA